MALADPPDEVELRFPASGAYVGVLRTVTAGLAARCRLTVDEIEDLRIAVDEACTLLLPLARPGASLTTTFTLETGRIACCAAVPAEPDVEPDRGGFAWTVLRALTDDVAVSTHAGVLSIALTKRRTALTQ
jgi:serine/threonine-protein kinase RsbW